jgi:hypothetical protein
VEALKRYTCIASLDAACPGLHRKPLDAAIGQLLTPYRPGSRQGNSKQNNDVNVSTLLAVLMAVAVRRYYRSHRPMEEVQGFPKSH